MEKVEEIITDEEIEAAWGNASFGNVSKRDIIAQALLKFACDYGTGYTIKQICFGLGLITMGCKLNTKGKQYLYANYSKNIDYV